MRSRPLLAFQIVQFCALVALLCKISFYAPFFSHYYQWPLYQDFFPKIFRSATGLIAVYGIVCVAIALSACQVACRTRCFCTSLALLGVSYLLVHQGVYNDVTFTTLWWTQCWATWYQSRLAVGDADALVRGAFLGRLVISLMLLGGAVGKWTAEYWSGQVFWEIYYVDRDFWFFNWQRQHWEPETLRQLATWYSRAVIITESVAGFTLWMLPARMASIVAIGLLSAIAVLSNFFLFSVVLSLIGLAVVGLFHPNGGAVTTRGVAQ